MCSSSNRLSPQGRGRIDRRVSAVGNSGEGGATAEESSIHPLTLTLSLRGRGDSFVAAG